MWVQFSGSVGRHLREVLTICKRSEAMHLDTLLKKPVGKISRQQDKDFKWRIMSSRFSWLLGWNCVMVFGLILCGHREESGGVEEKAWINISLVFSVIHCFVITSVWIFVYTATALSKKTQEWYERALSDTSTLEIFRFLEMTRYKVCPLLCVGSITCWVSPKLSRTQHNSLAPLSWPLSTWMLKSPIITTQSK